MAQARALGVRLAPRALTTVYTSPLRRAVRTAELALEAMHSTEAAVAEPQTGRGAELGGRSRPPLDPPAQSRGRETAGGTRVGAPEDGVEIRPRKELLEIDHGDWSGLSRAQVAERWAYEAQQWRKQPSQTTMPNGESLRQVRERTLRFLADMRQEHGEGTILVVTHGTVLRVLLAHFLDMSLDQIWSVEAENCALSIVDDYEVPLIMAINDTCHLEGVRSSLQAQVR